MPCGPAPPAPGRDRARSSQGAARRCARASLRACGSSFGQRLAFQERDEARHALAQLAAVHDHVDGALLQQELGALEAFGERLAHGLLDHARAGEADERAGSASTASPMKAKEAETPPMVGSVRTEMNGCRAAESWWSAAVVFAICMSERSPSCMRAPPVAVKHTKGSSSSQEACTARTKRSPTTEPMEPPRKPNSNAAATTGTL